MTRFRGIARILGYSLLKRPWPISPKDLVVMAKAAWAYGTILTRLRRRG